MKVYVLNKMEQKDLYISEIKIGYYVKKENRII